MKGEKYLPCSWHVQNLREVASIGVGGTPNTEVEAYWGGSVPWMTSGDVHMRRIFDVPGRITVDGLARSNAKLIEPPAVAVALAGQGKTRGTVALTECSLSCNQSVALIRGAPNALNTRYLFHELDNRYEELRARSSGGGRGGLSIGILSRLLVNLPSLSEQEKIAEILDAADEAIRSAGRLITKLEQARQGIIHDLLKRATADIGRPTPLGEVSVITGGVTLGRAISGSASIELPYLRVANVQDGYVDTCEIKLVRVLRTEVPRYLLRAGDVLMTEGGDFDKLGRGAVWDGRIDQCLHQNHIFRVRCDTSLLLPEFLAIYSASPHGRRHFVMLSKQTTNLASINMTQLRAFPIPIPPLRDQSRIVSAIQAQDDEIRQEQIAFDKLKLLKQGLMDDLLTGRVQVGALA
jgi:type I restriction enzyme, S subunit